MVKAIEPAVRFYENPPTTAMEVTDAKIYLEPGRLGRGVRRARPGTPHNEARDVRSGRNC